MKKMLDLLFKIVFLFFAIPMILFSLVFPAKKQEEPLLFMFPGGFLILKYRNTIEIEEQKYEIFERDSLLYFFKINGEKLVLITDDELEKVTAFMDMPLVEVMI